MHPVAYGSAGSHLVLASSSRRSLEHQGSRLLHRLVTDSDEIIAKLGSLLTVSLHVNNHQGSVLRRERSIMRPIVGLSANLPRKWLSAHLGLA
jgi:hypothetical protein